MSTKPKNTCYAYLIPDIREFGIVTNWPECEKFVIGIKGARYKGFPTRREAEEWLAAGGKYVPKTKTDIKVGIYFDAGTGRGDGVEVSVTDESGKDLLASMLPKGLVNKHGKHLLPIDKTNNYGELLACQYAIKIALSRNIGRVFGDSKLVLEYWSKGLIKKNALPKETVDLAMATAKLRKEFESFGGTIVFIPGADNPADLGFHK